MWCCVRHFCIQSQPVSSKRKPCEFSISSCCKDCLYVHPAIWCLISCLQSESVRNTLETAQTYRKKEERNMYLLTLNNVSKKVNFIFSGQSGEVFTQLTHSHKIFKMKDIQHLIHLPYEWWVMTSQKGEISISLYEHLVRNGVNKQ